MKIKEVTLLIKQNPKDAQAYADRAALKVQLQDVYGAIKDFSAAVTHSSAANPAFLIGRGQVFLEIGAFREALRDFDAALLVSNSQDALYGRAVAKYYLDDYFGAIRDLDEVIAVAPAHPKALYNRGVVKMELNQLEGAIADMKAFLEYHPGHLEAESGLATASARLERRFVRR